MIRQQTPHIERPVWLREETEDRQVWADTFTGLYHLPPEGTPAPSTVLDLGANIGLVSAHYRYLWPQASIVAVELDPANAALAERNAPGVRVRVLAVAAQGGYVRWDDRRWSDGYRLDPEGERVAWAVTLVELILDEFGAGGVDLVKMDIEGAELEILADAARWAPYVRSLVVELHDPTRAPADLVAYGWRCLRRAGYVVQHGRHPQGIYASYVA